MNKFIDIKTGSTYSFKPEIDNTSIYALTDEQYNIVMKYGRFIKYSVAENNKLIVEPLIDEYDEFHKQKEAKIQEEKNKIKEKRLQRQELLRPYKELNNTDYKVIKAMEAFLIAQPNCPEEFLQVHRERQANRDLINEREQGL